MHVHVGLYRIEQARTDLLSASSKRQRFISRLKNSITVHDPLEPGAPASMPSPTDPAFQIMTSALSSVTVLDWSLFK